MTDGAYTTPGDAIKVDSISPLTLATSEELVRELLGRPHVMGIVAYTTDRAALMKDVADRTLVIKCGTAGLPSVILRLQASLAEFIDQD